MPVVTRSGLWTAGGDEGFDRRYQLGHGRVEVDLFVGELIGT
jgi:hypothetical protein